jgi:hypothetical protein
MIDCPLPEKRTMTTTTFRCKCCEQTWPGAEVPEYSCLLFLPEPPDLCVMCEGHQDNILKPESEHAAEFKRRLDDAYEQMLAHVVERGELKRQILNLERDRDKALDALNRATLFHKRRATLFHKRRVPWKDCTCGEPHCETCTVGADPWVFEAIQGFKARKARGA